MKPSTDFSGYAVRPAMMKSWCHSAANAVAFAWSAYFWCPSCGTRRMAESAALLVDAVLPHQPMRQLSPGMACIRAMQEQLPRVLSVPFPLRYVFASQPAVMGKALGIVYLTVATHSSDVDY
jgi:hypothetical protein